MEYEAALRGEIDLDPSYSFFDALLYGNVLPVVGALASGSSPCGGLLRSPRNDGGNSPSLSQLLGGDHGALGLSPVGS